MAEAQLQQFLAKVQALNDFVALSERDPAVRQALVSCSSHHEVVELAQRYGFAIGRRWGEGDAAPVKAGNVLTGELPPRGEERISVLLETQQLRLERIHSHAAASPEGFWYEQREHEWVLLLQGSALVQLDGEPAPRSLSRGDQLLIPAGQKHRVVATDPDPGTIWLALFWSPDGAG
ncbi:MAG: Nif11 domain/cupin domain-containing protein [Prochlorococcaceae cyanobacterium]